MHLEEETQINEQDSEIIISTKLTLGEISCQYALKLYKDGMFIADDKEQLIIWKKNANSECEFNEIKSLWSQ
ncbi:hypothetical protein [Colwellia sp. RSH04]|uniref:hypothetical protein n=1 Tax=Colwellia sp. RSH04 TaxID=2305464 RepID=UPI000E56A538|nr:hypothetical protein [Colwellia sp. RSH04]RHW75347.1 hypothetical protein D1094_14625 [Colwellia sp. RSH04]